jgi:transposase InsO family protein
MDDATRFITGWQLSTKKFAATAPMSLAQMFSTICKPAILGTDNGDEFRGWKFVELLNRFDTWSWYGALDMPEQNRKIEQFGHTIDPTTDPTHDPQTIAHFIDHENDVRDHISFLDGMSECGANSTILCETI